ncbi:MAG: Ldh family oxidoreductase, partial [Anaerolineae bacterium]
MATNETSARISADRLRAFCTQVFQTLGVPEEDAFWTADVLVEADLRGVGSHGVARLKRYVDGLRTGVMVPRPQVQVVRETATTALVDGGGGLGQPGSVRGRGRGRGQAGADGAGVGG